MAMSIRKYIYASLALICLMCSCDPWLVPPVKITYEEDANGHKYVDLGLSVKWAAYDIGANSATELGDFFAWGETQPKKGYSWDTYKFAVPYKSPESGTRIFDNGYGKEYELTKYNLDPNSEYYDGKTTLDLIDDAAHMAWGGNWRMPTVSECNELVEKCEWTWTEYLGVYGYDVKGPNGNRMFLPHYKEASDMLSDRWFYRWSSNCLNNNDTYYNPEEFAYTMSESGFGEARRSFGLFVRAVYDKALPKYSVLTFDANGGEGLMHPQQFNKGVAQSIDSVRYTNGILNFVAWNTQPDGSGQSFANGQEITLDKNTTLYAQWALANGEENGYGYVDLGLPSGTKWAIYNVGATTPEGYGDYFAWGETEPKDLYDWGNYKFGQDYRELTKYCHDSYFGQNGFVDYLETLELTDDAAQVNWGGNWRMPSKEEFVELYANCSFSWYSHNGVEGTLVVSKINKNRIFFPAAGEMYGDRLNSSGTDGSFWTSSNETSAYNFYYYLNVTHILDNYTDTSTYVNIGSPDRYTGRTVRAVFNGELPAYYTITFDANGGEGYMPQREYYQGKEQSLPACAFTRFGYLFDGWNTAPDGSGISYKDAVLISVDAPLTLYAQWKRDPSMGEENGYDYVDLGLPSGLKWATCNVGATTPEGYGDYFAWGETSPKDNYSWSTYKYCKGSENTLTKYCNESDYGYNGFTDNKTTLDLSDDAARANWGGQWRMPTTAEQDELRYNCIWTWTTQNGVNGYKVTSITNGNSIFLPAAGYCDGTSVGYVGSGGYYWLSRLYVSRPRSADYLHFNSGNVNWLNYYRSYGHTVRAVCP
ncbi:MAG: InlB B-repeat-containing protein [Bacteroidales bacterium]|nr:InlB B-repeat-containing protein [Bacteroidales bacterium]